MRLWVKILIAMALGVATGLILGPTAEYLKPIGTVFLGLLNMIIAILIFSSMVAGITRFKDPKKIGRIGLKSLAVFLGSTLIAISSAMFFAHFFQLGADLNLEPPTISSLGNAQTIGQILLSTIPTNPVQALASGNIIQIIIFSIFFGFAITFCGEKGKPVLNFMESLSEVMNKLTTIVMEFSPFGVFAIMATVTGTFGLALLLPLLKFLGVFYLVCLLHIIFVFGGILRFMAGLKTGPFFKGMGDAIMMAFSTCSSSATLPVTMHCAEENLGVSKNISNFVLPLGITFNMNGTVIYQAMATVFIASAYGIDLDAQKIMTIVLTATLAAVGSAGVPGSGFIMLSAVLASAGLPLEGLALIVGIDRLRDMGGSALNITADAVVAVYIAKSEGELNIEQYNNPELVKLELENN